MGAFSIILCTFWYFLNFSYNGRREEGDRKGGERREKWRVERRGRGGEGGLSSISVVVKCIKIYKCSVTTYELAGTVPRAG